MRPTNPPDRRARCGVLLAGGNAARFGGVTKGLLPLGDARVADGPLRALHAVCDEVVIAANDADAKQWFPGHLVQRDDAPERSALGALVTALTVSHGSTVVVCAWDMPFITGEVLDQLAAEVDAGASCCVPVHADGMLEPLCAAYAAECAAAATQLLHEGEHAAHALFARVAGARWEIAQQLSPTAAQRTFLNVNTPSDLQLAASWLGAAGAAP